MLSIALVANADSLADLAGFSAWKFIPLERDNPDGLWFPRTLKPADFQDTRFEYRWKSERTLDIYVCTVEIRPAGDIGQDEKLPQINVIYGPGLRGPYRPDFHVFTARDVSLGKSAHATFKPADCRRVAFIYWRK